MIKIRYLIGNWKIKKRINSSYSAIGNLKIKKIKKNFFLFNEKLVTHFQELNFQGFQSFQVEENKKDIIFKFNLGKDKNKVYQVFNKSTDYSKYFCNKDLYFMNFKIINQNYFIINTKIKGPQKNLNIFTKYQRTI